MNFEKYAKSWLEAARMMKSDPYNPNIEEDEVIAKNWTYLAEGNSSIVYSCDDESRVVLRVKKKYLKNNCEINQDNKSTLENDLKFIEKILKPLIQDEKYSISTKLIRLAEGFKLKLQNTTIVARKRPDSRNVQSFQLASEAILMPHLGFYQTKGKKSLSEGSFAIEIKPKWGFLPKMPHIYGQDEGNGPECCRFCMHQYLKLKKMKITSISPYCPLDLFANCSCRVKRGIYSLFEEPQNNLRVFHNGALIYSGLAVKGIEQDITSFKTHLNSITLTPNENPMTYEALVSMIVRILIHDSWQGTENMGMYGECKALLTPICKSKEEVALENEECRSIGSNGILKKLLKLQQLSRMDASSVKSLVDGILNGVDDVKRGQLNLENYDSKEWKSFVLRVKSETILESFPLTDDMIFEVQKYLVSATFKDCSIMITFKEHSTDEDQISTKNIIKDPSTKSSFLYQIKLIDLDPKGPNKVIALYEQLERDIVNAFKERLNSN